MAATTFSEGDTVELRKHARDREYRKARDADVPVGERWHWMEGKVKEVGRDPINGHRFYVVHWEGTAVTTALPASDLKLVRLDTGRRKRHEELYGTHGLKKLVEREGERLEEAVRKLWVPGPDRPYGEGDYRRDVVPLEGALIFDMRREHYEKLVKRYNRLARIHDRDNCC